MDQFTPVASLAGGAIIGVSAALLMYANGKLAGISGIAAGALMPDETQRRGWRAAFVAGLMVAGFFAMQLAPASMTVHQRPATAALVAAGLLVGFGTRIGNGCTSGHGVCGLSRLSTRSLLATLTFITAGIATVYLSRHLLPGVWS